MERNMDLCRLILFKIETDYRSTALYNLNIDESSSSFKYSNQYSYFRKGSKSLSRYLFTIMLLKIKTNGRNHWF